MKTKSETIARINRANTPGNRREQGDDRKRSEAVFLLVFCLMAIGIAAAGYLSYVHFERNFRAQMENQLASIAQLKVSELQAWRAERLTDAQARAQNPVFAAQVRDFLEHPADLQAQGRLQTWLDITSSLYRFDRVFLLDTDGVERISSPATPEATTAHLIEQEATVLNSGQVTFIDFHRDAKSGPIYLALLVPIYSEQDHRPLGLVVMRIDPNTYLYPYIQKWPVPSQTAETLLVRREGNDVVFLNALRFQSEAALNLRFPLEDTQLPAVQAVLGQQGIVEGSDYRGVVVVAYVLPVPDSPWFVVAKMDKAEVYAPLWVRLRQTAVFFGVLVLTSGAGLFIVWRQQRLNEYRARVQTLEELRASEEKFKLAFETSPDAVAITRLKDGQFVSVNEGFERILGYTAEEVLGRTSLEMNIWEGPQARQEIVSKLQVRGRVENFEARFRTRDGTRRYGLMSAAVIQLNSEPHILNITRDITERKQAEIELRQMKRLYATLSQVNQTIVRVGNRQELFDSICKVAVETGKFRLAWVGLLDPQTGQITPAAEHGEGQNKLPFQNINVKEEPYRNGLIGLSLQSGFVQFSQDIQADARMVHWHEAAIRGNYHSAAAVPFKQNGKIVGLLNLYAADIDFFTVKEEQRLLEEMGLDISFALDKMENESRRERAEQKLRESEEKYRGLFTEMIDGFALHEMICDSLGNAIDYVTLEVNPAFESLLNAPRDMVIGKKASEILSREELDHWLGIFGPVALTGESAHYEMYSPLNHKYFQGTAYCPDKGKFAVTFSDITDRKRAEEALRLSEARYRMAQAVGHVGNWEYNLQTAYFWGSPEAKRIYGFDPEQLEFSTDEVENCIPERERVHQALVDLIEAGKPYNLEFEIHPKDSSEPRIISSIAELQRDEHGHSLVVGVIQDITERKQAEEKLITSETHYRRLFESAKDGILILNDETGIIVDVNPFLTTLLGYSKETFLEKHIWELGFFKDIAANKANFLELQQKEYIRYEDLPLETAYGYRIDVEFVSNIYQLGHQKVIQCNIRDITGRKQAEERIKTQLERLASLRAIDAAITSSTSLNMTFYILLTQAITRLKIDAASVLLFNPVTNELEVCARQGFYASDSQARRVRMGEDIAGRCAFEQTPLEDHFLTKEDFSSIAPLLSEEGFTCYVAMPLMNKAKILGVLEIFEREHRPHDQDWVDFLNALTGQAAIAIDNFQLFDGLQRSKAMLEQRVAERTWELYKANTELERANHAKDEFLATMSHELRTPLNSILGLSESLLEQRRGPLNEHQQKSLQIIEASGRHLLDLINDILDLSKIDAGKFDIYPQIVEVNTLCQSSLAFVRQLATKKSISLTFEEDKTVSKFQADPRRMKQILVNLLTNAVKFTPNGGHVTLQVRADAEQDLVQFSVIDNGIGIAPEDLKRLFQPFVQVDSNLNRQFEGTGLGLALVHKLTDLHGGSVQVESEVDKGSRFTINLPWHKVIVEMEDIATSRGESAITALEEKTRLSSDEIPNPTVILLAEDNLTNTLTIGEYLESHGYKVTLAHDGWEAISKAEEINPKIILMDIQMPSLDGLEATRRLRANPRFATTPIIALTALAMPGDRERCLEAGANEYMSKPVSLKTLAGIIEKMLEPEKDISQ